MSDDYAPLPYAGELTDDNPQLVVIMSQSWWSYVRGAFDRCLSARSWDTLSDVDAALVQAIDAMARLVGESVVTALAYPTCVWLPCGAVTVLTADSIEWTAASPQYENGAWEPRTPVNGEDLYEFAVALPVGTYVLGLIAIKASGSGKFRWVVDGVERGIADDTDLYASPTVFNYMREIQVEIDVAGQHTFLIRNIGKNPASVGYNFRCNGFYLSRLPD